LTQVLDADLAGRLLGTRLVGAEHTLIGERTVERLHARGIAVGTHTLYPLGSTTGKPIAPSALDAAEAHRLAAAGIDWIETDDPERLLEVLARRSP
jgi:glycerophosphoryl diester phosphodiesterase